MTDQIPADKVRDLRDQYMRLIEDAGTKEAQAYYRHVVKDLDALLPTPTLADMTPEERRACQWMQADIIGGDEPLVITRIDPTDWTALILDRNGRLDGVPAGAVAPRPDLPRMEWPGDTPAPAPIAPEDYPPRDQLTLGAKWADITKLEEALRKKGEAADQAIVLDDEGDVHVWESVGGGGWIFRIPVQQCGPFRVILNEQEADQ